jgi:hypothetical protein
MLPLPSWLTWKLGGYVLGTLGALAALVWAVNTLLAHERQAGRDEVQAQWNAEKAGRAQAAAELTSTLSTSLSVLDKHVTDALASNNAKGQAISVNIAKEAQNDPRYVSADCSLTNGVRDQINAARSLSGPAGPVTVYPVPVPTG